MTAPYCVGRDIRRRDWAVIYGEPNAGTARTGDVERERRRAIAANDVTVLVAGGPDPDGLDDLARFAARVGMDLD